MGNDPMYASWKRKYSRCNLNVEVGELLDMTGKAT